MTVIQFAGKTYDARHTQCFPSGIRVGNFVLFHGELMQVVTIQRDCPTIESLSKKFSMFTLVKRDGTVIPARNLVGLRDVYKARR